MAQVKTCAKCGETKPVVEFHKHQSCAGGLRPDCKSCRKREAAEYYIENKERILKRNREWALSNPDLDAGRHLRWRENNIDKARETGRRHQKKRRATAKGKLESSVNAGVRKGIRKGSKASRGTFDLLGYSVEELKRHLERQFSTGMSWENYGRGGWEIDHIIPLSAHNYQTPDDLDFKRAWALANLRPLWMPENRSKHAKLAKPFQPSLLIATNDNRKTPQKETTHGRTWSKI